MGGYVDPIAGLGELKEEKNFTFRRESKVETADLCTDAQFVNHLVCGGEGVMV
jgi:hypothetical protein